MSILIATSAAAPAAESSPEVGQSTQPLPQHFVFPEPEKNKKSPDQRAAVEEIDALLQKFIEEEKASSLVGFVAVDGEVRYSKAFGWKDKKNKTPASVEDYYVLFSQTKAITTVAFMTLVEQGLVNIDDPVSKYFPGIPNEVITAVNEDGSYETRPATSPMTFVHLMAHTSGLNAGLAGEARLADSGTPGMPLGFDGKEPDIQPAGQHTGGGNYQARTLEEEMLELAKYPLGFDPGSEWNYHVSTNMLGYMIERISGQSLQQYVKEKVLKPLGMNETDWYYEPEAFERFVKPYSLVDGKLVPGSDVYARGAVSTQQTYAEGAIGLNGPITDYAKFCQMLLNKGTFNGNRILKPETIALMTTINRLPKPKGEDNGFRFGLGFELYNEQKKPAPEVSNAAFAWGGMMGTDYIIDPDKNLIALFYLNMYQRDALYPEFLRRAYAFAEINR
ncbi:serine hydrolase [Microbulbifer sp. YPW1]|uniref:serine hydrolase domain-containing protein n=1 Tax=Microbulbifer sp. YPW1 TaxID=2745199 RepID=UPI0015980BB6|nr:serine hydrolase domain-containing protein [Microbulbifer sp. YPW1]QKX16102.1 beta-lactamase family protein [Microbulbifer sp. YPW1]